MLVEPAMQMWPGTSISQSNKVLKRLSCRHKTKLVYIPSTIKVADTMGTDLLVR
jgi:hypothetical protein